MAVSRRLVPVSEGLACRLYSRSVCDDSVLEMIATGVIANYYPQTEATPGVTTGQPRITPRVYTG